MASESHDISVTGDVGGLLPHVLFWVTSLAFLLIEKEHKLGRLHAQQTVAIIAPLIAVTYLLGLLPAIGRVLTWSLTLGTIAVWAYLMVRAGQGTPLSLSALW